MNAFAAALPLSNCRQFFNRAWGLHLCTHTHTYIASAQLISGILAKNWVQPCGSKTVQIYIHLYSLWALDFQLQLHAHTLTHTCAYVGRYLLCLYNVCVCVCNSALHTGRYAFHFPHVDFAFGLRRCAQSSVKSA